MTVETWLAAHFSPLRDRLFAIGLGLLDGPALAEEAAQRTALEAFRHADALGGIASPARWLRFTHRAICCEMAHTA